MIEFNANIIQEAIDASGIEGYTVSEMGGSMIVGPKGKPDNVGLGAMTVNLDMTEGMIIQNKPFSWIMDSFFVRFEDNIVVVDGSQGSYTINLTHPDSIESLNRAIKIELGLVKRYEMKLKEMDEISLLDEPNDGSDQPNP